MDVDVFLDQLRQDPEVAKPLVPKSWDQAIELFNYQKVGVLHLAAKKRFILGDPVGSGKTPQCLYAWALVKEKRQELGGDLRLWVVTTRSAVHQWAREVSRFIPEATVFSMKANQNKAKRMKIFEQFLAVPGSVLVSSWGNMLKDWSSFKQDTSWFPDTQVVFDEAQKIKNPKSQLNKVASEVVHLLDRAQALTATLVKDKGHDAFHIAKVFYPGIGSLADFEKRYCVYTYEHSNWYFKGGRRQYAPQGTYVKKLVGYRDLPGFREQIKTVFLGRTDFELGIARPEVVQMDRYCEMGPGQQREYDKAEVGIVEIEDQVGFRLQPALAHAQQVVNTPELFGCQDNAKLDLLRELLGEELEDDPVLLYSPYETTISTYWEALKDYAPVKITGQDSDQARKIAQEKFQSGETNLIFITDAGGEALNLQRAKHVVFISRPWSPGQYTQVVGRARRFGSQHEVVTIWHLTCQGTIDEYVDSILGFKFQAVEDIVRGRGGLVPDEKVLPFEIARKIRQARIQKTKREVKRGGA